MLIEYIDLRPKKFSSRKLNLLNSKKNISLDNTILKVNTTKAVKSKFWRQPDPKDTLFPNISLEQKNVKSLNENEKNKIQFGLYRPSIYSMSQYEMCKCWIFNSKIHIVKELLSQLVHIKNSTHDKIIIKLITEAIQSLVLYRELRKIIKDDFEITNFKSNMSHNSIKSSEKLLDLKWRHTFLQWINKVMKILSPKIKEFQSIQRLWTQIKHVEEISSPKRLNLKTKSRVTSKPFSCNRINSRSSKFYESFIFYRKRW